MNKARILLMYAGEYDMKDEDGRPMSGCILNYYFYGKEGEMLDQQWSAAGPLGFQRAKCNSDIKIRNQICAAPGIYDAEFSMKVGSDGKPVLMVQSLEYVGKVTFNFVGDKK